MQNATKPLTETDAKRFDLIAYIELCDSEGWHPDLHTVEDDMEDGDWDYAEHVLNACPEQVDIYFAEYVRITEQ